MKNERQRVREKATKIGGWANSQGPIAFNTPILPKPRSKNEVSKQEETTLPTIWKPRNAKQRLW